MNPGEALRKIRESLNLSFREVESASQRIAAKYGNADYAISLSRLSDIESKDVNPSIYKLYTLSAIYRVDYRELLACYGIEVSQAANDITLADIKSSHRCTALAAVSQVRIPVRLDPAFDYRSTTNLGRMVMKWGVIPMAYLEQFADTRFTYGYVGTEDYTMYPLLLPGSFLQIDESRNKVVQGRWHSEYQRPIYFVETREGYTCCWCELAGNTLILQPHPLSPVATRTLRHEREAEVIGQVVGVAMQLGEWTQMGALPKEKAFPRPT